MEALYVFLGSILLISIGIALLICARIREVRAIRAATTQDFWERAFERDAAQAADHDSLSGAIEAISAEAGALLEAANRLPELFDALLGAPGGLVSIACEDDGSPTPGALKLRLSAQASEGARSLLSALRAGNLHLGVVERELGHLISSPVVASNTSTVAAQPGVSPHAPPAGNGGAA